MSSWAKQLIKNTAVCILTLSAAWVFLKYLLRPAAPFILAFIISRTIQKPVDLMVEHLRIPRRLASFICTALFFALIIFAAKAVVFRGFAEIRQMLLTLPEERVILENITCALQGIFSKIFGTYAPQALELAKSIIHGSTSLPVTLQTKLTALGTHAASFIPNAFLFIITALTACYFFSCDYPAICAHLRARLPERIKRVIRDIREKVFSAALSYLKAVVILAAITFSELLLGLFILRANHAFASAFFISLLDALPVFGCGFVLIPWALGALITGAYTRAVGLAALYLIITLVRNLIEARIIGTQTGLHPLISLASVYIGVALFGAYGLFAPPLLTFLHQFLRPHKSVRP